MSVGGASAPAAALAHGVRRAVQVAQPRAGAPRSCCMPTRSSDRTASRKEPYTSRPVWPKHVTGNPRRAAAMAKFVLPPT